MDSERYRQECVGYETMRSEHTERERAGVGDQAFGSEIQLEPHLERDGPLISRLVAGYNHTTNSAGRMTFQDWP